MDDDNQLTTEDIISQIRSSNNLDPELNAGGDDPAPKTIGGVPVETFEGAFKERFGDISMTLWTE